MKKNYLLSVLLSVITLGAWASGGASFSAATSVQGNTPVSITYDVVGEDDIYQNHWFKYTATNDHEFVFIEDAATAIVKSEGTLRTEWPSSSFDGGIIYGSPYFGDTSSHGTRMYVQMKRGETITFNLYAPDNKNSVSVGGKPISAAPITSSFKVVVYNAATYPGGESKDNPIVLAKNTERLIFPIEGDDQGYVWLQITPDLTGRVSFQCPFGMIYQIIVVDKDGKETRYLESTDNELEGLTVFNFMANAGEQCYVKFYAPDNRIQVKWSMVAVAPGNDCLLPKEITTVGTYAINPGAFYYKYKATADGYVVLTSSTAKTTAAIYNTCYDQMSDESVATKTGFYMKRAVVKDETIIIEVQGLQGTGTFNFALSEAELGWDHKHAIKISNIDQVPSFTLNPYADKYWFEFTSSPESADKEYMIVSTTVRNIGGKDVRPGDVTVGIYQNEKYSDEVVRITPVIAGDSVDFRPDASSKYYVCWEVSEYAFTDRQLDYDAPGSYTFEIKEKAIPAGKYCDLPIDFTLNAPYTALLIGNDEGIPANQYGNGTDMGTQYNYKFTAQQDGTVHFTISNPEWSALWSIGYKKSCDDVMRQMPCITSNNVFTYKITVEAGKDYIWCPHVYTTNSKVEAYVAFTPPAEGEVCSKPIMLTLGEQKNLTDLVNESTVWYGVKATKTGVYKLTANAGGGGYVNYKVGDCGAFSMKTGGGYGAPSVADIYAEAGQDILMGYFFNDWTDNRTGDLLIEYKGEASPGSFAALPITVEGGVSYTILSGTDYVAGAWYLCRAKNNILKVKFTTSRDFDLFKPLFVFEASDPTTQVSNYSNVTQTESVDNGDGTWSSEYTFTEATANTKYLIMFENYAIDAKLVMDASTVVGLENNNLAENVAIYPNPNNGEFTIVLGEMATEGAIIEVTSLSGSTVYKDFVSGGNASVNLYGVTSGVYLVKISNKTASVVKKMIIR